jgi:hypothetical protein
MNQLFGPAPSACVVPLGMQIHSTTYNNNPKPNANMLKRKAARHIHDGIGVAAPKPPQTPPIISSFDDLVAALSFCHVLIGFSDEFTVAGRRQHTTATQFLKCKKSG